MIEIVTNCQVACVIIVYVHLSIQTSMSVTPTMEVVNRCVIIPLVASTASAGQASSWIGMD